MAVIYTVGLHVQSAVAYWDFLPISQNRLQVLICNFAYLFKVSIYIYKKITFDRLQRLRSYSFLNNYLTFLRIYKVCSKNVISKL